MCSHFDSTYYWAFGLKPCSAILSTTYPWPSCLKAMLAHPICRYFCSSYFRLFWLNISKADVAQHIRSNSGYPSTWSFCLKVKLGIYNRRYPCNPVTLSPLKPLLPISPCYPCQPCHLVTNITLPPLSPCYPRYPFQLITFVTWYTLSLPVPCHSCIAT